MDDAEAINILGYYYAVGIAGLSQDLGKALELWHRAAELGHADSYHDIGYAYLQGYGVERRDKNKAVYYWELAAIGGTVEARHNLGLSESNAGNFGRALKHYMINVEGGNNESLTAIKQMCMKGYATNDDYAKALQAYQAYLKEIKSDDRDKAAVFSDKYKYYV